MATGERGRKPKASAPASKLCVRCNKVKPLGDFYLNKDWIAQSCHDAWCKDCCEEYCKDKDSLITYCGANNRRWDDSFWDKAGKKAQYVLATNAEYLDPKSSDRKKE